MPAAVAAGAATAAAAAGAFQYNRKNYLFDATLRFQRYTSGYQFAIEQAAQYREDIRDFTELTVAKQDIYTIIGTVFMMLTFQLILAGRLGIYGPAPPGWMMGLYFGNITTGLMFLMTMIWLSLHASARATAGGAHMLTRSVRLPVPSPKQLDKARKTGNSFEKQRVTDTFRVPFVAPAPKDTSDAVDTEKGAVAAGKRRMPRWYQDEQRELGGSGTGGAPGPDATPEHFELYRGLQQEWWCHETYVRVGALFFMSHWLTAAALYTQCHAFSELRALWVSWSITPIFCVAHWCLLKIDILPNNRTRLQRFAWENVHPWMPLVSCFAMSWEYSSVPAGGGWRALIYVLAWICYSSQFLWILKLYDLAEPVQQGEHADAPGQAWWPEDWSVPPAFNGALCLVAPPKTLEPGQVCLQLEMHAAKGPKGATAPLRKQRQVSPQLFPWKMFRGAIIVAIAIWFFIMCGRIWEERHGERYLLKTEGRQIRFPAHVQGGVAPWTRAGTPGEMAHTGGSDRRLGDEVSIVAQRLASVLGPLSETMKVQELHPAVAAAFLAPRRAKVSWPAGLAPSILASKGENIVAALATNRRGVIMTLPTAGAEVSTSSFDLAGIEQLGDVVGASWGSNGLLVSTSLGSIVECSGLPVSGSWPCRQVGSALPTGGSSVTAASAVRVPGTKVIRAAVSFASDAMVSLFEAGEDGEWLPTGEVQLRGTEGHVALHLSFSKAADELLVSSHDGSSMKWRIGEVEPVLEDAPQRSAAVWHAACSLEDGRIVRLATKGLAMVPELLLSSKA